MSFVAIMEATPENRVAKVQTFVTDAEAAAHVALFAIRHPDAFTAPEPADPLSHWLIDMVAKTITIVPPPPPDYAAIDQTTVDRLLLESGVMRALAKMEFNHENRIRALEGQPSVTASQFKAALKGLIR